MILIDLSVEELTILIKDSNSLCSFYEHLGYSRRLNHRTSRKIKDFILDSYGIDLKSEIYKKYIRAKNCPVCGASFSRSSSEKDSTTCSRGCANTFL